MKLLREYINNLEVLEHSKNTEILAREFGVYLMLREDKIKDLSLSARYHDIGKGLISNDILNKRGKLTNNEYEEIKRHSILSFLLLENKGLKREVLIPIIEHHEKINGTGYPYGKKGEDISYEGKILALCDSYEAMTGKRGYKNALTKEEAILEIEKNLGTQFDKELGDLFISFIRAEENIEEQVV